jgi:hypothetical protein
MQMRRLWGVTLLSVLGASVAVSACGSDDAKRRVMAPGDAGAAGGGGEAAANPAGGQGATPASAGNGGASSPGLAGEGGSSAATSGGASGEAAVGGVATVGGAGGAEGSGYANEPVEGDTFASPLGSDAQNDCSVEATPCKTITFAASQAAPGHTVWLASATFTNVDQPLAASVVNGIRVRAREPGEALLQVRLTLLGSHRVEGLLVDGGASGTGNPGIDVTTGTVVLEGVAFSGRLATALKVSGDAVVTVLPGGLTDYVTDVLFYNDLSGYNPFTEVSGNAQLTLAGGTFGGPGLGYGAALPRLNYGAAFAVRGDARLVVDGVTLKVRTRGIGLLQNASVRLLNSSLTAVAMTAAGYGVWAMNDGGAAKIEVEGSTISGFANTNVSAAIAVLDDPPEQTHATVRVADSTLSNSSFGVFVNGPCFGELTFDAVDITNNSFGGVFCPGNCTFDMTGGSVSGNGSYSDSTGWGYYGGLHFGGANRAYDVKLRGVTIQDNRNIVNNGNTNAEANSGLTLAGTAASLFDLGTGADPGGNTFVGNDTGNATSNLNVKVNPAVVVSAVGNTFDPSIQAATAAGTYALGTPPCSAGSCNLTSGAGANYRVTSGTLRLAE